MIRIMTTFTAMALASSTNIDLRIYDGRRQKPDGYDYTGISTKPRRKIKTQSRKGKRK